MDLHLQSKIAIVTGAGRGIGLATARALAAEGTVVIGATRTTTEELAEVARVVIPADLTDPEAPATITQTALDLGHGIDIVVNCVGTGDFTPASLSGFLDTPETQWTDLFHRNLFSTIRMAHETLPHLVRSRGPWSTSPPSMHESPPPAPSATAKPRLLSMLSPSA